MCRGRNAHHAFSGESFSWASVNYPAFADRVLQVLKAWLFKENIRIMMASAELEEKQEKFEQEKDQFKEEMKGLNRKMNTEQERIRKDSRLVDEKLEIIKDGFRKLDMDRRRLDKEWARLAAEKELMEEHGLYDVYTETSVFFRGVKNILTLKKRYKDKDFPSGQPGRGHGDHPADQQGI